MENGRRVRAPRDRIPNIFSGIRGVVEPALSRLEIHVQPDTEGSRRGHEAANGSCLQGRRERLVRIGRVEGVLDPSFNF